MKRFCVFSGFLGSGKTTVMMELTKLGKTAMISNDLGGKGLADNRLARLSGCNASELTGDCICYQTENLVTRLEELFDAGNELVISDIPGFGVGALEHVYHTLNEKYPGRYELAPFTVLTEPRTVTLLEQGGGDLGYILDAQLREADLIVLNKLDLLCPGERDWYREWLMEHYPQAKVLPVCGRNGEGIQSLSWILKNHRATLHRPEIGYGGEAFRSAMGRISEYNIQYHTVVCCHLFDGNHYLLRLAEYAREGAQAAGHEIPHLKLLAWAPEGDYGKADLIGVHRETEVSHSFAAPVTELAVVLNASADCPADLLDQILTGAVDAAAREFNLENTIFQKECFGMG